MAQAAREPLLRRLLEQTVLSHETPAQVVAAVLARRLGAGCPDAALQALLLEVLNDDRGVLQSVEADLVAVTTRDLACRSSLHALLHFRVSGPAPRGACGGMGARRRHRSGPGGTRDGGRHPSGGAHRPGRDARSRHRHRHRQTALIEDNVSILHGVTLGATG
jgi:serine O-acetyltransferase